MDGDEPKFLKFNQTLPLVRYMPKIKEEVKRNLLSDDIPLPEDKKAVPETPDDGKFYSYFKKELYLYLIYDPNTYGYGDGSNGVPIQIRA
jgi:hypothetical protein